MSNWKGDKFKVAETSGMDAINGDGKIRLTFIDDDLDSFIETLLEDQGERYQNEITDAYNDGKKEEREKVVEEIIEMMTPTEADIISDEFDEVFETATSLWRERIEKYLNKTNDED